MSSLKKVVINGDSNQYNYSINNFGLLVLIHEFGHFIVAKEKRCICK